MAYKETLDSLGALDIGQSSTRPPNFLLLKGTRTFGIPKFQYEKLAGKFRITEDQEYSEEETQIPKLIAIEEIEKLRGRFLGAGYENAILIPNYQKYHELIQEFFLKWLIDNKYFAKIKKNEFKNPDFICFGGRITDPLQSPLRNRYGEWEIYAARFNDTIYLWDVKTGDRQTQTKESFYGTHYESLLTGKNPATEVINELDKTFEINQLQFGKHQLLVLNEVDAVDEDDNWTEIKVWRKCSPLGMKAKYVKMWAQSIVAGVKTFVVGRRDDDGRLQETVVMNLDELQSKIGGATALNRCYDFEDRLLSWIKDHFKDNDPTVVKKFCWPGGGYNVAGCDRVTCSNVSLKETGKTSMLTKWFLTEAMDQLEK